VAAAKAAVPGWRGLAPADRARLLYRWRTGWTPSAEALAVLEARNAGKPIGDARGEMQMVVDTFRYYAGAPSGCSATRSPWPAGRPSPSARRSASSR
jgi:betaine-aldehyde dehydrogenase